MYILFTAGRGPVECCLAVKGVQNKFRKYLDVKNIKHKILSQKNGDFNGSIETIILKIYSGDKSVIEPWLGSIQWICKSPIRKFHKRKNWFIKCQEIGMPQNVEMDKSDVVIQAYRASGPGGQHRNKVETAIRIIHKPSGIIVTASDGKSQIQNKKKAWQKLEDKINEENEKLKSGFISEQWLSQITIERGNPVKTFRGLKFTY